ESHEQHAARSRLDVLLCKIGLASLECTGERVAESVDDRADRNLSEWTAEALGEPSRVGPCLFRRIPGRHRHAMHTLRSERLRRQCGGHGGIDSARDADDDLAKAVLPHVVAEPELEGA